MTIDEFKKIDLRTGVVREASRVDGSDKLLRLSVDLDEPDLPGGRQIIAGVGKVYAPEDLVGKQIAIVANLEPRKFTLRGASGQVVLESNGMLLAAHDADGNPAILMPERAAKTGSKIT